MFAVLVVTSLAYPHHHVFGNRTGLHVSTASKTNKAKSDTYAICKSVVIPSLALDQTKDYYATKLGGVCPSHEIINTASECSMAYQSARRTWQPTIMNGKQGANAGDMHKNDKGWSAYPAGYVCVFECLHACQKFRQVALSWCMYDGNLFRNSGITTVLGVCIITRTGVVCTCLQTAPPTRLSQIHIPSVSARSLARDSSRLSLLTSKRWK